MTTIANTSPIYSAYGDIQGGDILTTVGTADYTGTGTHHAVVFSADVNTGGFIQRLRFKALNSNNTAAVARIYINNGGARFVGQTVAPGTPTATTSTTGGFLLLGTYFAKVIAVDQYGGFSPNSAESTVATLSNTVTGSITWNWTASPGAASYRLYVGPISNGQITYFSTTTNTLVQRVATDIRDNLPTTGLTNNRFIGELSLPATTAIATAATADIDYPLNLALPPGDRILVGLGATQGGWQVTGIGGSYA